MGYNKVFKLVLSIFTFIFYLMGFFIPHKVFIGMSKFAIFLYYKPLFIILFIVLLILFSIVIISIVKNSKFSSRAYLFTSTLMLVLSLYCVYDGIFNIETYFEYYTIIGIAPFLMLIISIWSFLFYFYEEKIFAYFIKKRKINHLIGKMIRIFFAILILFAFITPLSIADLSSLSASWDIRRTIILAHDRGLINFILLILYYGFVLIFSKKLNLKIINTTSFILVILTLINFLHFAIINGTWFDGVNRFDFAFPYLIVLTILSFFIYIKNNWLKFTPNQEEKNYL